MNPVVSMFGKLTSFLGLGGSSGPSSVLVQYQKSLYEIAFDESDSDVTVGFLRAKIGEVLECKDLSDILVYQIKPQQRKLVGDNTLLADYDIRTGDKLLTVLASERAAAARQKKAKKQAAAAPKTPAQKIQFVEESVEKELVPFIEKFISSPPETKEDRDEQHHRLGELVLQKMFLLDDVDVSEDSDLRQKRKSAINRMHSLHQSLDEAWKAQGQAGTSSKPAGDDS